MELMKEIKEYQSKNTCSNINEMNYYQVGQELYKGVKIILTIQKQSYKEKVSAVETVLYNDVYLGIGLTFPSFKQAVATNKVIYYEMYNEILDNFQGKVNKIFDQVTKQLSENDFEAIQFKETAYDQFDFANGVDKYIEVLDYDEKKITNAFKKLGLD